MYIRNGPSAGCLHQKHSTVWPVFQRHGRKVKTTTAVDALVCRLNDRIGYSFPSKYGSR